MEKFSHQLFYQGVDSQDSSHDDDNHDETDQILSESLKHFLNICRNLLFQSISFLEAYEFQSKRNMEIKLMS